MKWADGLPSYDENAVEPEIGRSPYYTPWDGWQEVAEIDYAGSYAFSTVVVWTDGARLIAAHDTGCSCPTPFDGLTQEGCKEIRSVEDLEPLIAEARAGVDGWTNSEQLTRTNDFKGRVRTELGLLRIAGHEWRGYAREEK